MDNPNRRVVPSSLFRSRRRPVPFAPAPAQENRPSGLENADYRLKEIEPPPNTAHMVNGDNTYLRAYLYGPCSVLVTREGGRWHASVAHPSRYPTWEEISGAWYQAIPGAGELTGVMVLPRLEEYVNIHNFCLHVFEADQPSVPR